jgi:riboflavin kinase/FMN adenylyltransferase
MLIIESGKDVPDSARRGVVAIGNFDGVHRGHQALLDTAKRQARHIRAPFGVVTFEPHPRSFFRPQQPLFRLSPAPLKQRLMRAIGADFLVVLEFNRALAQLEAEQFIRKFIVEHLRAAHVVTGYDFHFGHGRKGNPEMLRRLAPTRFEVTIVDQVTDDDGQAPFSSSAIRNQLRHGRVGEAALNLGYRWQLTGEVVKGDGRGAAIGFPTANIGLDPSIEPLNGIYAVSVRHAGRSYHGAGYIGERPTFATGRRFLEVHLLEFAGDLYSHIIDVVFVDLIRADMKFSSATKLIDQMRQDTAEVCRRLTEIEHWDPLRRFAISRLQADGLL